MILSLAALLPSSPETPALREAVLTREVPLRIKRRGVEMRLVMEGASAGTVKTDPVLLKELRRAHRWFAALLSGRAGSLAELARREGVSDRCLSRVLPLAFLAPEIVDLDLPIAGGRRSSFSASPDRTCRKPNRPF